MWKVKLLPSTDHSSTYSTNQTNYLLIIGEARDMSSEQFTKYMNDLNKRIFDLVNSTDAHEKMGGIMVIGTYLPLLL
jgi:hypothetical protein